MHALHQQSIKDGTLSGNGQAGSLFEVVDAGLASIHYDTNITIAWPLPETYDHKTKIVVFYSLSLMNLI